MIIVPKVKCPICEQVFDRDKEECVKIGNRYYHPECVTDNDIYIEKIFKLAKELWGDNLQFLKLKRQLDSYIKDGVTSQQIYESLVYFFVVKKNDPLARGQTFGIVPYVREEAHKYFLRQKYIVQAKQKITHQLQQQNYQPQTQVYVKKEKRQRKTFELEG